MLSFQHSFFPLFSPFLPPFYREIYRVSANTFHLKNKSGKKLLAEKRVQGCHVVVLSACIYILLKAHNEIGFH